MTGIFGPQGANAVTTQPSGATQTRYTGQTWVKDASAPGLNDGTVLDAAFYNRIVGNLDYLIGISGVAVQVGDMDALYKAVLAAVSAGAPTALSTLKELADAINDDQNFAGTVTATLGNCLRMDIAQNISDAQRSQVWQNLRLPQVVLTGSYNDLFGKPTLGTAAGYNVGTNASNIVQLDGNAHLPAVNGSALVHITWGNIDGKPSFATVATSGSYNDLSSLPTLGTAASKNVGAAANNVVQLDANAKLPALDASQLINLPSGTIATQAQAQAGTDNVSTMTALRTAQAIAQRAPHGHLWGLNCSNDGTTPLTVLDIALGEAASQNGWLMSAAAFTKNCNAAWALGSGNGALDAGSSLAASTTYHLFQIMRTDTWVVDYLLSTSATAPTMPTNYTEKRRIASIRTDASSHILPFKQQDDFFYWGTSFLESPGAVGAADTLVTMRLPTGIRVEPFFHASSQTSVAGEASWRARSPDLQSTDGNASYSDATASFGLVQNVARLGGSYERLLTNTSAQLTFYVVGGGGLTLRTYGWCDTRGRLS